MGCRPCQKGKNDQTCGGYKTSNAFTLRRLCGGGSPQGIEIYGNNCADAGGIVTVETAAGGSPNPEAIVLDRDGLRVFGHRAYNLDRMRSVYFVENIANPATETGKSKLFSGTDGALRLRRGDGTLGIAAPKAGVMAQSLVNLR